jgi:8-oxo-dGTP pyrophosphatase MutT (NUDIX family)
MKNNFMNSPKVQTWKNTLESAGCSIEKLEPVNLINNSRGELLFALVRTQVIEKSSARRLLPYALIRGHACVIVPRITHAQTGEMKFVMVRQRRIGNGHDSLEFPAGMLDSSSDPVETAVKELHEETGLSVSGDSLYPLHSDLLYSSPGLLDEGIYYFGCELTLRPDEYEELKTSLTGKPEEGEYLRVELHEEQDAVKEITSLQTRLGFFLYREHEKNNS